MDAALAIQLIVGIITASAAAGGAWFAVRTEMRYMRRDIDRNREAISEVRHDHRLDTNALHDRVSRLNERLTKSGVNGSPQ